MDDESRQTVFRRLNGADGVDGVDDGEIAAVAFMTGSFAGLLASDVAVSCDGTDVFGSDDCALFLATTLARLEPDAIDPESVNGEPGLALRRTGRVIAIAVLRGSPDRISRIWLVTATERLRSWN